MLGLGILDYSITLTSLLQLSSGVSNSSLVCHDFDCPHLQSTSILEDLLAVGLGLVRGTLRLHVSIAQTLLIHNQITYSIVQSSLVTTKDAAVLAETSTWGIVTLLSVEGILTTELLESLLAVLLGLLRGVGAGGRRF